MHIVSHAILRTQDGKFLLQQRDRKPDIASPGVVGFFGGSLEGAETPEEALIRELREELELVVGHSDMRLLWKTNHFNDHEKQLAEWYFYLICNVDDSALTLHEGAAMYSYTFEEILDHPLVQDGVKEGLREHEAVLRIGFAC